MKDKELREEFEPIVEITKRIAQIAGILNGSAVHDTGQTVVAQQKLGEILGFLDQALKAKEEEVVEGVEKMMPGDKEVNFEENNEAGIKRKVLFEILTSLKGKKK